MKIYRVYLPGYYENDYEFGYYSTYELAYKRANDLCNGKFPTENHYDIKIQTIELDKDISVG